MTQQTMTLPLILTAHPVAQSKRDVPTARDCSPTPSQVNQSHSWLVNGLCKLCGRSLKAIQEATR